MDQNNKEKNLISKTLDRVVVYYYNCSTLKNKQLYDLLYGNLPEAKKHIVDQFKFEKDKFLSIGAWSVLSYALKDFKKNINDYTIAYTEHKKPYLENCNIKFNISHSGDFTICAIAKSEIGCDVQIHDPISKALENECMTKNELEFYLSRKTEQQKYNYFYKMWTVKESIMKMLGQGLYLSPKNIETKFSTSKITAIINDKNYEWLNLQPYTIDSLYFIKGYSLSVCSLLPTSNIELKKVDFTH